MRGLSESFLLSSPQYGMLYLVRHGQMCLCRASFAEEVPDGDDTDR